MKKETRKQEIIKAAALLFKEKGYSAVTMRDIAQHLGIKAASLYNHIKAKQEILTSIIVSLAEEFTAEMDQIIAADATNTEKLELIIALHVAITTNNPNGMATLNADWMHLEEKMEHYLTLRTNYEQNFKSVITAGIKNNEIKAVDSKIVTLSILATLRSLYLWLPESEHKNQDTLTASLSEVLLKGVCY